MEVETDKATMELNSYHDGTLAKILLNDGGSAPVGTVVGLMAKPAWDAALLNDLSQAMADASICGLGQAAPNPIACVFKYFANELV